jgi:hypothetical protein
MTPAEAEHATQPKRDRGLPAERPIPIEVTLDR